MLKFVPILVVGCLVSASCGGGDGQNGLDRMLQNSCVHDNLNMDRIIGDGKGCSNFSYSDCRGDPFPMASDCVNYCAFDICQPDHCVEDADCLWLGIDYECKNYIVSDDDYGLWCDVTDCPKGTPGCPCLPDGSCQEPDEWWEVTCNAQNVCEGGDNCPSGCRVGSVCCGGALCAGNCIGTPCC